MLLNSFNKKEKLTLFAVAFLFCLFFIFRILSQKYFLKDSYEYLEIAKKIATFSFFENDSDPSLTTRRPFFYPLFLALFYNFQVLITLLFQTLFSFLTVVLLFDIVKFFNVTIKPYFIVFFICTPSIFIYSQVVMSEWLVMFLLTLLFWLIIQGWNTKNFIYIQIITLVLAFTKPVFYPFLYVSFVFFIVYFIKTKRFNMWLFFPIIVLQLYMSFNEKRTGYYHFSSIENINLINYNLYYFKANNESIESANQWKDSVYNEAFYKLNFEDQNHYLKSVATNTISNNFFQYLYYHFINSMRGILDPGRFDLLTFFDKEDGKQGFLELLNSDKSFLDFLKNKYAFVYLLLIPVFLFGLIKWFYFFKYLFFNKFDFYNSYIVVLMGYYILTTGPINCSRFMMPVQGIVFVFSVLGFTQFKKKGFSLKRFVNRKSII